MGGGPEQILNQKRNTDGQQAHEKMLHNAFHQGNANQNHNEIPPHSCRMATIQKPETSIGDVEKLAPCTLLVGIQKGEVAIRNRMVVPQRIKHRMTT